MESEVAEYTRAKAIEILVDDDFGTIQSGEADYYLRSLLIKGFDGYEKYTNDELAAELMERGVADGEEIKVI